jgi:molybdenum cofactor cytidylyltransferase
MTRNSQAKVLKRMAKQVGCVVLAAGWSRRMRSGLASSDGTDSAQTGSPRMGIAQMEYTQMEYTQMEYTQMEYTQMEYTQMEYTQMESDCQKLLLPVYGDVPMVRHVVETALQSHVTHTIVVVNPAFPGVTLALAGLPVEILQNHATDGGMSTSFRLGIEALHKMDADAGLFLLGDQPGMEQMMINQVLSTYENDDDKIVQACYHGIPGHPVLFDRTLFASASEATGDEGGRRLIERFAGRRILVEMGMQNPGDIDTVDDYKSFLAHEKGS